MSGGKKKLFCEMRILGAQSGNIQNFMNSLKYYYLMSFTGVFAFAEQYNPVPKRNDE